MGSEVLEDEFVCKECMVNLPRYCHECQHFVQNGDRCDLTKAVCYVSGAACRFFEESDIKLDGRIQL